MARPPQPASAIESDAYYHQPYRRRARLTSRHTIQKNESVVFMPRMCRRKTHKFQSDDACAKNMKWSFREVALTPNKDGRPSDLKWALENSSAEIDCVTVTVSIFFPKRSPEPRDELPPPHRSCLHRSQGRVGTGCIFLRPFLHRMSPNLAHCRPQRVRRHVRNSRKQTNDR
jgi:hypothetical protein